MATRIDRFSRDRRALLVSAALGVASLVGAWVMLRSLWSATVWTGSLLFGCVLLLAFYGVRKRIAVLPLGRTATWLRWHAYVGLLSALLFVVHGFFLPTLAWRFPDGWLERAVAIVYVCVAGTGVVGLAITRRIPARISARGEEVIFERIGDFRMELFERSRALVLQPGAVSADGVLSGYFTDRLAPYFSRASNLLGHLAQSRAPMLGLRSELDELSRYLSASQREVADELVELIEKKDELDYQYAHQLVLKGWLFLHSALVGSLLLLASLHAVLALSFGGRTL